MGYFRFHKSVGLGRLVRLNLSKSGVSVSMGVNGARVNVGSRGVRTTVGIPNSGLSYISTHSWKSMSEPPKHTPVHTPSEPIHPDDVSWLDIIMFAIHRLNVFLIRLVLMIVGIGLLGVWCFVVGVAIWAFFIKPWTSG